jgi:hypothetical protein
MLLCNESPKEDTKHSTAVRLELSEVAVVQQQVSSAIAVAQRSDRKHTKQCKSRKQAADHHCDSSNCTKLYFVKSHAVSTGSTVTVLPLLTSCDLKSYNVEMTLWMGLKKGGVAGPHTSYKFNLQVGKLQVSMLQAAHM